MRRGVRTSATCRQPFKFARLQTTGESIFLAAAPQPVSPLLSFPLPSAHPALSSPPSSPNAHSSHPISFRGGGRRIWRELARRAGRDRRRRLAHPRRVPLRPAQRPQVPPRRARQRALQEGRRALRRVRLPRSPLAPAAHARTCRLGAAVRRAANVQTTSTPLDPREGDVARFVFRYRPRGAPLSFLSSPACSLARLTFPLWARRALAGTRNRPAVWGREP